MSPAILKHAAKRAALGLAITLVSGALAACGGGSSSAGIGGIVSGLASGTTLTLQNNGGDNLTLVASGNFQFATKVESGSSYNVSVLTQPVGQACQIGNASGTVDTEADTVSSVVVACVTTSSLGGTVTGLNAGTAVTLSNGSVLLPVGANGAFAFPGTLAAGATYSVTVATQPAGETCTVTNGSGTVPTSGAVTMTVACS